MFGFKKKENGFFDWFVESATFFYQGALLLNDVMEDYTKADQKAKEINDIEHAADHVNDRIIDQLNTMFITPIDREDIYALANGLDDGVDQLQGVVQRIAMYRAGEPMPGAVELTKLLIESTQELIKSLSMLKDIRRNKDEILASMYKIGNLESEGDRVYRSEVANLFEHEKDPIRLIKWKDILENLEDTLDHCEAVSDMIRGVVMKYA